ncbi:isocitrate lyase/phosphoenolpyruvate mutase family protein [Streptomyces sp. NBC_01387]|uniref:isocitrate lyase/PEP mutase family protein n=1 Tax=unclassified Streptomyces TaxID=2593676 RepID=UPI002254A181|nr:MULTISPECIES: isocitrate lyase/phosphoenolpyruvate mutase family protein [unclassified Streptomyces]MCX4549402.1 isocitrate lyase/phosphoenolpyruvate mutase family protein [Streptomyces sp. NBC_01500]WSC20937.1 isocitrate lyase/phosphoenolpyruvate mutase family protein [Streptomyces sp. NBC_01766]WSV54946.1 isocitrate lyase/phosphoenolpyruvate mutase family protein [Streptomyces sp. NBC_01014]
MNPFEEFRALHHASHRAPHRAGPGAPEAPLVLPNAWDHASAAALAAAGFRAIGTTSLGVAAAAGKADATGGTRAETVRLARGLARLSALISVDIEGGFSTHPDEVASLAVELADAGVVGVNIEDGRPDGSLTGVDRQCELIRAVKDAVPELFVNARTDTYWLPGHTEQTTHRAEAYQHAGADGLFVPGLQDAQAISALTGNLRVPLNILFSPAGPSVTELAALGVRRVSCGSLLFRAALQAVVQTAGAVATGAALPTGIPSYAEAQALSTRFA